MNNDLEASLELTADFGSDMLEGCADWREANSSSTTKPCGKRPQSSRCTNGMLSLSASLVASIVPWERLRLGQAGVDFSLSGVSLLKTHSQASSQASISPGLQFISISPRARFQNIRQKALYVGLN